MTAHHHLFLELFLTAKVDTAGFSAPQSDMTLESVLLQSHKKEFTIQTSACISNIQYHHAIFTTYNDLYVLCHSHNEMCMVRQQMYMSPTCESLLSRQCHCGLCVATTAATTLGCCISTGLYNRKCVMALRCICVLIYHVYHIIYHLRVSSKFLSCAHIAKGALNHISVKAQDNGLKLLPHHTIDMDRPSG